MIYFDNAATTFPKPKEVIKRLSVCAKRYSGNPGRSSHRLSVKAAEIIYDTRECVSELFSHDNPESVVFTYNATYALNLAIKSIIPDGGHIITSDIEHNAVMRPIFTLQKERGVDYSVFSSDGNIAENIEKSIRKSTVAIVSTIASNVTGRTIALDVLSDCAKRHGLYLIIDASQAAGHTVINIKETPCDVLCAPAHKGLYGIQGTGFALFKSKERLKTLVEGGSGFESISQQMPKLLPDGYEAGTLATPSIAALGAGVKFVRKIGVENIGKKISYLSSILLTGLHDIKNTVIYPSLGGIISFNISGVPASEVARELDRLGIAVRAGLHCAPSAHKKLGTLGIGTVRASLSYMNDKREIERFCHAVLKISKSHL